MLSPCTRKACFSQNWLSHAKQILIEQTLTQQTLTQQNLI
jgi:hypothetical protein